MGTVIPAITFGVNDAGLPYVRPTVGAFTFLGPWVISTNYLTYSVVTSGGSIYVALLPNVGVVPGTRPDIWGLMIPPSSGVSNVACTVPSALLAVSGSPITSTGTLAVTLNTQAPALVFASPRRRSQRDCLHWHAAVPTLIYQQRAAPVVF